MLAKLNSENQLTLPQSIVQQMDNPSYFEVTLENGKVILTPVQVLNTARIREKLESVGITEQDVEDAIQWSRKVDK